VIDFQYLMNASALSTIKKLRWYTKQSKHKRTPNICCAFIITINNDFLNTLCQAQFTELNFILMLNGRRRLCRSFC